MAFESVQTKRGGGMANEAGNDCWKINVLDWSKLHFTVPPQERTVRWLNGERR